MIRHVLSVAIALGALRDPGCGSGKESSSGPNAPCTRERDCRKGLVCAKGVCVSVDELEDAGSEGDGAVRSDEDGEDEG